MATPILGLPELVQSQAIPETTVNDQVYGLEGFASLTVIQDRDENDPTGLSPSEGDRYLVASGGTDVWTGHDGDIARYQNGAWEFHDVFEGLFAWVVDETKLIRYHSAAWAEFAPQPQPPAVSTQSGTSYTAVSGDANTYIRFTSGSAVGFTIPANASVAFAVGTEIHGIQAGAGALTLIADTGVTLNSYGADLVLAGQWAGFTAKKVATNTWDVVGKFA